MRCFPLGDVLSIVTGRVLSRGYVRAMYDAVSYMWGQSCHDGVAYIAMYPECKLWLLKQYPQFGEVDFLERVSVLDTLVKQVEGDGPRLKAVVFKWVDDQVALYGAELPVRTISDAHVRQIDLVEEAQLIMGPGRVILP
jgi:hypothetical protein